MTSEDIEEAKNAAVGRQKVEAELNDEAKEGEWGGKQLEELEDDDGDDDENSVGEIELGGVAGFYKLSFMELGGEQEF